MYTRICPECSVVIIHKRKANRNVLEKQNKKCIKCSKKHLSKKFSGEGNPFYGKKHSQESKDRFSLKMTIPYEHELPNSIWNILVNQAKRRKIEFDLSKEEAYEIFINQNKKCKLSNMDISFAKTSKEYRKHLQTASLDRIDSNLGYTIGNVQWVHKKVNFMKHTLNEKEFIQICMLISNNQTTWKK